MTQERFKDENTNCNLEWSRVEKNVPVTDNKESRNLMWDKA